MTARGVDSEVSRSITMKVCFSFIATFAFIFISPEADGEEDMAFSQSHLFHRAAEFKQAMSFYEALMRCRGNLAALHFSDGHHSYYATPIYLLYSVYTSHLVTHITLLLDTSTALLV